MNKQMVVSLLVAGLLVLGGCATVGAVCTPKEARACDPTQLEHWEDLMMLGKAGGDEHQDARGPYHQYSPAGRHGGVELR